MLNIDISGGVNICVWFTSNKIQILSVKFFSFLTQICMGLLCTCIYYKQSCTFKEEILLVAVIEITTLNSVLLKHDALFRVA
jgi:hypothetical protein